MYRVTGESLGQARDFLGKNNLQHRIGPWSLIGSCRHCERVKPCHWHGGGKWYQGDEGTSVLSGFSMSDTKKSNVGEGGCVNDAP